MVSATIAGVLANFYIGALGPDAFNNVVSISNPFSLLVILGVSCLLASVGFSVAVVIHYKTFTTSFDTEIMHNLSKKHSDESFFLTYIKDGEWYFRDNEKKIGEAQSLLWFAMVFAFSQTIPWTLALLKIGERQ